MTTMPSSCLRVTKNLFKHHNIQSIFARQNHAPGEKWHNLQNKKFPRDLALQHFDSFYPKVYNNKWLSIRIAMHWGNKYCAVVNPFAADPDEIYQDLRSQGAIELGNFYDKHYKYVQRYKLRQKILEEKKAKKILYLAEKRGVKPEEIESDVEVSDVSDSELKGNVSSFSEPENIIQMFETDIEAMRNREGFIQPQVANLDLNDYVPCTEMAYKEEVIETDSYYHFYKPDIEIPVELIEVERLNFPENPKMFVFPRGSLNKFEQPTSAAGTKLLKYCLLDAASVLPVVTLDIQAKDRVADLCAAPGGKALTIMLTMKPSFLLCCEPSASRFDKLKQIFNAYVPRIESLQETFHLEQASAQEVAVEGVFDKVLADVPCTNDRLSIQDNFNSLFKPSRVKERIAIPEKQKSILMRGLRLLKPGGSLVYSTCSLSPIQNDGVVHMSLLELTQETGMTFTVDNLKEAYRPLRGLYRFYDFKYGQQVIPFLPNNCGPMYISKINRVN